jgi:hypothetical protein
MKNHKSHIIDATAIDVFKCSLPKEDWKIYDISPDYGKDQKVELIEDGELTGKSFWVQLKGQEKPHRRRDGVITFKLETEQLKYHLKLPQPMFLVVIDVKKRTGYWVCTQSYAANELKDDSWRRQTYIQIRLDPADSLSNPSRLRTSVERAIRSTSRMAIRNLVLDEKRELEEIDPRFRVEITDGHAGPHYSLVSVGGPLIEVVPVGGDASRAKFDEMLDTGRPASFDLSEMAFKGSPLVEALMERAGTTGFRLEACRKHEGFINIERLDRTGKRVGGIYSIRCKVVRGRRVARFEATYELGLLGIKLEIAAGQSSRRHISMPINLAAWSGHRLLDLPYFECIYSIFGNWRKDDQLIMEIFVPGEDKFSGNLGPEEGEGFGIHDLIDVFRKAREVAAAKGVNPVLKEGYSTGENFAKAEELHDILIGDGLKQRVSEGTYRTYVDRQSLTTLLDTGIDEKGRGTLRLVGDGRFSLFGEVVTIDPLERIVTEVRLASPLNVLRDESIRDPDKQEFLLEWEATEDTVMTTRANRDGEG